MPGAAIPPARSPSSAACPRGRSPRPRPRARSPARCRPPTTAHPLGRPKRLRNLTGGKEHVWCIDRRANWIATKEQIRHGANAHRADAGRIAMLEAQLRTIGKEQSRYALLARAAAPQQPLSRLLRWRASTHVSEGTKGGPISPGDWRAGRPASRLDGSGRTLAVSASGRRAAGRPRGQRPRRPASWESGADGSPAGA